MQIPVTMYEIVCLLAPVFTEFGMRHTTCGSEVAECFNVCDVFVE